MAEKEEGVHRKHYLGSDGNGGFNVSKSIAYLTIVMMIISLVTSVVTVTSIGVRLQEQAETTQRDIAEMKTSLRTMALERSELSSDIVELKVGSSADRAQLANIEKQLNIIDARFSTLERRT